MKKIFIGLTLLSSMSAFADKNTTYAEPFLLGPDSYFDVYPSEIKDQWIQYDIQRIIIINNSMKDMASIKKIFNAMQMAPIFKNLDQDEKKSIDVLIKAGEAIIALNDDRIKRLEGDEEKWAIVSETMDHLENILQDMHGLLQIKKSVSATSKNSLITSLISTFQDEINIE